MTWEQIIGLSLARLVMLTGLLGNVIPALPGTPLLLALARKRGEELLALMRQARDEASGIAATPAPQRPTPEQTRKLARLQERVRDIAARLGISAEVLDLRSLQPLDEGAILASLQKTGRLVVVDEATPRCGIASDVAALCVDCGFDSLNGPVKRVTAPHAPVPFSGALEDAYMPSADQVVAAVRSIG